MSDLPQDIVIGGLAFRSELRGAHYHVQVRGYGMPNGHPLLGTLVMDADEWRGLCAVFERDEIARKVGTIWRDQGGINSAELDALAEHV